MSCSIIAITKQGVFKMSHDNHSLKEKLIISATNFAREKTNVDPGLWVFINNGDIFKSINHSGLFEKDTFVIRYNRDWIKIASEEQIIKTAFHETLHAVQQQVLVGRRLGLKSNIFTEEELNILEHEFKDENYDDSVDTWHTHLSEQQAETFAAYLFERFNKDLDKHEELVTKYYKRFINEE